MRKLDRLINSAVVAAKWRGHNLFRFTHVRDVLYLAQSTCRVCGAYVGINSRPLPNEIEIHGEGVALDCRTVYENKKRRQDA